MVGCGRRQPDDTDITPTPTPTPAPVTLTAPAAESPTNLMQLDTLRPQADREQTHVQHDGYADLRVPVGRQLGLHHCCATGYSEEPFVVAFSKTGVPEGTGGKTSVDVDQDLQTEHDLLLARSCHPGQRDEPIWSTEAGSSRRSGCPS